MWVFDDAGRGLGEVMVCGGAGCGYGYGGVLGYERIREGW